MIFRLNPKYLCIFLAILLISSQFYSLIHNAEAGYEESTVFLTVTNSTPLSNRLFNNLDGGYISFFPHFLTWLAHTFFFKTSAYFQLAFVRTAFLVLSLYSFSRAIYILTSSHLKLTSSIYIVCLGLLAYVLTWDQLWWFFNSSYFLSFLCFSYCLANPHKCLTYLNFFDFSLLLLCLWSKPLLAIIAYLAIVLQSYYLYRLNHYHKSLPIIVIFLASILAAYHLHISSEYVNRFLSGNYSWAGSEQSYLFLNSKFMIVSAVITILCIFYRLSARINIPSIPIKKYYFIAGLTLFLYILSSSKYGGHGGLYSPLHANSVAYSGIVLLSYVLWCHWLSKHQHRFMLLINYSFLVVSLFQFTRFYPRTSNNLSAISNRNYVRDSHHQSNCYNSGGYNWRFPSSRDKAFICTSTNELFSKSNNAKLDALVLRHKSSEGNRLYKKYSLINYDCHGFGGSWSGQSHIRQDISTLKSRSRLIFLSKVSSSKSINNKLTCSVNYSNLINQIFENTIEFPRPDMYIYSAKLP